MSDKLTIKQEKYAQGLFAGLSQREAYKQAYNCENMMDKSTDENACVLANDIKVVSRLEQLTLELTERNMVTKEKVLAELAHIAFDNIDNYLSYKTVKTVVDYDKLTGQPILDYKTVVDLVDSKDVDTRSIAEVSIGPNGTFKFKQYCKDNALLQLGKHLGMFVDNVKLSGGTDNTLTDLTNLTTDERASRIAELLNNR